MTAMFLILQKPKQRLYGVVKPSNILKILREALFSPLRFIRFFKVFCDYSDAAVES